MHHGGVDQFDTRAIEFLAARTILTIAIELSFGYMTVGPTVARRR